MFKLGLLINPYAGIGGPLALKGSDSEAHRNQALADGASLRAAKRVAEALQPLVVVADRVQLYGFGAAMAGDTARAMGFDFTELGLAASEPSTAVDTINAAIQLKAVAVDLLLFAGGDGTARDIVEAVGSDIPVLGIPSGVKMHSGVYAISPASAGEIALSFIYNQLINIELSEVRDIDEAAFRRGQVRSRFYGELLVPRLGHFLQRVKDGGRELESLVLDDIAAHLIEELEEDCLYLVGPGSTTAAFMSALGLDNTLLGVDVVLAATVIAADANEQTLLALLAEHRGSVRMIITAIGGQGHILGRGNQQFSPAVIRRVGLDNITVIATKSKIKALDGRPLLVDTNDPALDSDFSRYWPVITGYHDVIIYPLGLNP